MSTDTESPPPRGATAIVAFAGPACAPAQTAVIAAAVAADGAAFFVPRTAAGPAATATAPPERTATVAAQPAGLRAS